MLVSSCGGGSADPAPTPSAVVGTSPDVVAASAPLLAASAAVTAGSPDAASETVPDAPALIEAPAVDSAAPLEPEIAAPAPQASAPSGTDSVEALPQALAVTTAQLLAWNQDWPLEHEALPLGVPSGYDWYAKGRIGRGNTPPAGFAALIGWGQVLWAQGDASGVATAELRNLHTYVCAGADRRWVRLPGAEVTGAVFRPDYAANAAQPALATSVVDGTRSVTFGIDGAFHFWPSAGRADLPAGPLCGVLVMLEARRAPSAGGTGDLLVGLGGDYWLSKTAAWDNYTTNADIGIGRMKLLTSSWRWYGMSTTSDADLARLNTDGFTQSSR